MIPKFTDGYFMVSKEHGFLPMVEPLSELPERYSELQSIIRALPKDLTNLDQDLLVDKIMALSNCIEQIRAETEIPTIAALYRAYCFLASGYLLYPSYVAFKITGEYGQGRDRLPQQLAEPLLYLASKLDVYPFLEYSFGYSLGNYVKKDPTKGLDVENLDMACCFSGTSDETGFIMVHVDINQHTPNLIEACDRLLDTMDVIALRDVQNVLCQMNQSRRKMWEASRHQHYNDFRVYIMGVKGNHRIFPNGVIYEPEIEPRFYRGQSGSQDTIIPFLDCLFRVCDFYPMNELTSYLMDMRSYRPQPFRELLVWTEQNSQNLVKQLLEKDTNGEMCGLLYDIYKQIYEFRNGHWQFVQKYIMANTCYPMATGGTPITTWLPNQILATLAAMRRVLDSAERFHETNREQWLTNEECYAQMLKLLEEQSKVMKCPHFNSSEVFELNKTYSQQDKLQ
jgi:indoleamine 2,3-dioxygenase